MALGQRARGVSRAALILRAAGAVAVVLSFLLLSPRLALCGSIRDVIRLAPEEVVEGDYFAAGETVEVLGEVRGDVVAIGGTVVVAGRVDGDLILSGGSIEVTGQAGGDARLLAGTATISGSVGGNVSAAGGTVRLAASSQTGGDISAAAGHVSLAGTAGGSARVLAGDLVVSGRIGGDLSAAVGEARFVSGARVAGDFAYWSKREVDMEPGAGVGGSVIRRRPPTEFLSPGLAVYWIAGSLCKLASFVSTLILGLVFIWLFPGLSAGAAGAVRRRPLSALGLGLIYTAAVPGVAIILFLTVVGIPLGIMLLALYLVSLYLSRIFVVLWAGKAVLKTPEKGGRPGCAFVLGLAVYFALTLVPVLGGLISIFVILLGAGAAITALRQSRVGPQRGGAPPA
ncbi:MAG: hypothetical protein Kow0025_08100 [Thermodesulfovibrionales bacterium]